MLRNVHPQDVSIEPFKTYKRFQFTNVDSGSGVYGLRGVSGSYYNFITGSEASQSFGVYNSLSASLNKNPYSLGTYYSLPLYYTINNLYYERFSNNPKLPKSSGRTEPFLSFGATNPNKQYRILHNSCSIISIQQDLVGEEIKPKSVKVTDNSTDVTFTIKDDGDGNLYDNAYSSSYAAFKSGSFEFPSLTWNAQGSGSVIGNVFYKIGMLVWQDMPNGENFRFPKWQRDKFFDGDEFIPSSESEDNFRSEWKKIIDFLNLSQLILTCL